ncbi:hypothetical protein KUH03_01155 [Sphingobacterium sp. E70]|nr:hypothetical protein [Sphingobacterium sp. E70]ULT25649.1 hypothetical protein KUH03_01155 [Sphingobacterium sp. E70]
MSKILKGIAGPTFVLTALAMSPAALAWGVPGVKESPCNVWKRQNLSSSC